MGRRAEQDSFAERWVVSTDCVHLQTEMGIGTAEQSDMAVCYDQGESAPGRQGR